MVLFIFFFYYWKLDIAYEMTDTFVGGTNFSAFFRAEDKDM